jgi:hypothetical protein
MNIGYKENLNNIDDIIDEIKGDASLKQNLDQLINN